MSEWIDVNLPWDVRLPWIEAGEFPPNLRADAEKHFGITTDELYRIRSAAADVYEIALSKVQDKLNEQVQENCEAQPYRDTYEEAERLLADNELTIVKNEAQSKVNEFNNWMHEQPEYIVWDKEYNKNQEEQRREAKSKSFCGLDLNKPGTIVETDEGQYLIGHINETRGVCDDCVQFEHDTIIKRYKIVWTQGESQEAWRKRRSDALEDLVKNPKDSNEPSRP